MCVCKTGLLLRNGASRKAMLEWLVHSHFCTTANIYAHLDYCRKRFSASAWKYRKTPTNPLK